MNRWDAYVRKTWEDSLKAFKGNRYKPKHVKDGKPSLPNQPYDTQLIEQDYLNTIPRKITDHA